MKYQCPVCCQISIDYPEGDTASCGICKREMEPYHEPAKKLSVDPSAVKALFNKVLDASDRINPSHYKSHPSKIECIEVTRHMSFNIGNAIKYLWRCDLKNGLEDLKKAAWYINDEIKKRENDNTKS